MNHLTKSTDLALLTCGTRVCLSGKFKRRMRKAGHDHPYYRRVGTVVEVQTGFVYEVHAKREGMFARVQVKVLWDGDPVPADDDKMWVYDSRDLIVCGESEP